ncbi:MAG: NAD(P)/FAD-dependent oxidoreductase [Candidatus Baltobacteraceae bacterium]
MIIGAGPAGITAALMLGRSRRDVLLCDNGSPRNEGASEMRGFISRDGASPASLLVAGRSELERYRGVRVVDSECMEARRDGGQFVITLKSGERYVGRRLLLASGVADLLPEIPGLREMWGRSIFVCPYCEGWELQEKRLAVFGAPHSGIELAQELYQWSRDILVCGYQPDLATAEQRAWLEASGIWFTSSFIRALSGEGGKLQRIEFVDGSSVLSDALFLSAALSQRSELSASLGCEITEDRKIAIDAKGRTSVRGCFAAGDAVTAIHQVIIAAASGANAAVAINDELTQEDAAALVLAAGGRFTG